MRTVVVIDRRRWREQCEHRCQKFRHRGWQLVEFAFLEEAGRPPRAFVAAEGLLGDGLDGVVIGTLVRDADIAVLVVGLQPRQERPEPVHRHLLYDEVFKSFVGVLYVDFEAIRQGLRLFSLAFLFVIEVVEGEGVQAEHLEELPELRHV